MGLWLTWQVFSAPPSPPTLSPAEAKAAAAKAKADPKAAAAAAAEAAAVLAAMPLIPCSLLSPALAAQLNPLIFTPCKVLVGYPVFIVWYHTGADAMNVGTLYG